MGFVARFVRASFQFLVQSIIALVACRPCRRRANPTGFAVQDLIDEGKDHMKNKDWQEAIATYSKAIKLMPEVATPWVCRSCVYWELHDWQQALRDAVRAVQLEPENPRALYAKALALSKLYKIEEALEACDDGLAVVPDSKELQDLQKSLQSSKAKQEQEKEDKAKEEQEDETKAKKKEEAAKASKSTPAAPAPKPKPVAKPAAKASTGDFGYSKWANMEFSSSDDEDKKGEKKKKAAFDWSGPNPPMEERLNFVEDMLELCRKHQKEGSVYFGKKTVSPRTQLPPDHKRSVGVLSVKELAKFKCSHSRMLVSIYGDIYDVSARPDLYGYGPKSHHSGHDITWAVVTGEESAKNFDRFYDIFKLDEDHRNRYMQIICQRMVAFEEEFGEAVGRLQPFVDEQDLPPPPTEEIEECNQQ